MKRFMIGFLTVMALWAWILASPSHAQMVQLEVVIVTPDNRGNPKLILEGTMVNGKAEWKLVYRKGEQAT